MLLVAGGSWLEKRSRKPETRTELPQETAETMEVDGVTYRRRTDLTTILVMGIDHDSEVEAEGSYQGGQADFQRLIVIDSKNKTVRQLKIDCDTMAEVTVLGMLGNPVGTTQMQISLAHGFGDGKEESCGYARDAVSRLLQGENINFYLAMSLDGISVLNDLAGGVTVMLEDDFSAADPAMTRGTTLTLHGDQAEIFVRRRMDIGEGTNEARMVRQEEYLAQLSAQLESRVQQEQQFTAQVYDALQPYLVTDLAKGQLVNEVWAAKDDTVEPAITLEGEHKVAEDGFTEFYPTEASIRKAVLTATPSKTVADEVKASGSATVTGVVSDVKVTAKEDTAETEEILKDIVSNVDAGNEAFNTLTTNLSFAGANVKKIMLTSSHASEGKSYLSMNLMRTLAQRGIKVALVDADLRRSMVNSDYGLKFEDGRSDGKGLSHFLAGMVGMDEVIYQTDIPNAIMVPVGRDVPNPLALLTNSHFAELLNMLARMADYVIVDAPPVGVVIDAAEIAKACDGTLIAVHYNDVSRQELLDVKQQIEQTGCPILGTVLNQVDYDNYMGRKYYKSYSKYGKYGYYRKYYKRSHEAEKK